MDLTQVWQEEGAALGGEDLNKWIHADFRIETDQVRDLVGDEQFRLVWEASVGAKEDGNIAIDDVTFTPGCV